MEEFKFARIFRDGIILQRDKEIKVWGRGAKGRVTVVLTGAVTRRACCDSDADGGFCVRLDAVSGGNAEYDLRAECASGSAEIHNVCFGDVLLLAGQSNLSYCLSAVEKREEYEKRVHRCRVSVLHLQEDAVELSEITRPKMPQRDLKKEYEYITQDSEKIMSCSAIGVMSAVLLYENSGIPVGIIDTSMGGLSVESYLPREAAEEDADLKNFLVRAGRYVAISEYNRSGERNFTQLSGVYNEKIVPLTGLNFRAIIWYLGESSAFDYEYAQYFKRELAQIVTHYRSLFGDIPFLSVQIAPEYYPYGDRFGYLYVNESIFELQNEIEQYYAIPTYCAEPRWLIEDGDLYYHPIHTVNKEPVAKSIMQVLMKGQKFPSIASVQRDGAFIYCRVSDVGLGLAAQKSLGGFTIGGENGKYFPAQAEVVGKDVVRLFSPHIQHPVHMTYAFCQDQSACNVCLKTGEALLPFRSEKGSIHKGYYFSPPYWGLRQRYVRENCFGYNVGTCRLYPCWETGKIYGASCRIAYTGKGLKIKARSKNRDYFFFGISPNICLSGQRNHLADFDYMILEMKADTKGVTFYGIAVRNDRGEVFRFAPLNSGKISDCVPMPDEKSCYCVELKRVYGGDMSVLPCSSQEREKFVQAEFLFRSKEPCTVDIYKTDFSDEPSMVMYGESETEKIRQDSQLPKNNK